ncbi:MAG TPA: hypothetical protein VHY35_24650 [Stellaceae bacterium]|jgi:D-alanine-D-alanine ligase|nr:hypothetical protein [Stellaceae bacterium]
MPSKNETRVAVFLGGRSPEHDVSVITGLQALAAIDQERFRPFPVYISPRGGWYVGDALTQRRNYLPDARILGELTEVTLMQGEPGRGVLAPKRSGLFGRRAATEFDVALLAFHGLGGEDGQMQGALETANLPYTGMRTLASAVFMDKVATKRVLSGLGIPTLPYTVVSRTTGGLPPADALTALLGNMGFPCIVKPMHLGSSIGVGKADDIAELRALLPAIFRLDTQALIEPFIANLVEYNLSVTRAGGTVRTSAIERPKRAEALLDFRQKYMSGADDKSGGAKGGGGGQSQGMLSLTRDINPDIPEAMAADLRRWAVAAFEALDGTGAPRIDFYGNAVTGETWLNEINPCPGSFGYFLWEAAEPPVLFTTLLTRLIEEALARHRDMQLPDDPVPPDARLLRRP